MKMKMRSLLAAIVILSILQPVVTHAEDLFLLSWRGTQYTTNVDGRIIAVPFTERDFINEVAKNNGLDPSRLRFVYRPNKRDTVVVRANGAFVANVIQMEFVFTDVTNPRDTVTVRHALLFDEAHWDALGSFFGMETRNRNANRQLVSNGLVGTVFYSKPELNSVYTARVKTLGRLVDKTNAP
ncbi:MAG TPA: hypothetical protein VEC99_05675 [Clostridia bacterium]|nr:hypothetical protein [Clostridia bacterium]